MDIEMTTSVGTTEIPTEGGDLTCEVAVQADGPRGPEGVARHLSICLDVSGSMSGEKLDNAKQGVKEAIDVLEDDDYVSIVTFSSDASLVLEPTQCDGNRTQMKSKIDDVSLRGGTDIAAGINESKRALIEKSSGGGLFDMIFGADEDPELLRWLVLLSDGKPTPKVRTVLSPFTSGTSRTLDAAEDVAEEGITIQSVGVGSSYNEEIMRGVAEQTQGKFTHIGHPDEIRAFFRDIVEEAGSVVEVNPELKITPHGDVTIGEIYQHKPRLNEFIPEEGRGTLQVELPEISADMTQKLLIELEAPPGRSGTSSKLLTTILETSEESVQDEIVVSYRGGKRHLNAQDKKRIDTKARRLAVEKSPDKAQQFLKRVDPDAVLSETRTQIEKLKQSANSKDTLTTKEVTEKLTRPGLTTDVKDHTETDSKGSRSGASGDSSMSEESTKFTSDTQPESATETDTAGTGQTSPAVDPKQTKTAKGPDVTRESDDKPAVSPESTDQESADKTALALITNRHVVSAGDQLEFEVRDESGDRVQSATVSYSGGNATTNSQGKCSLSFPDQGEYTVKVTKDGSYGSDSVQIEVTE